MSPTTIRFMPRLVFLISLLLFSLATALPSARADEPSSGDTPEIDAHRLGDDAPQTNTHFGPAHRQEIYEEARLERRRALLYTLALPGAGNFYAEQYALGTVAIAGLIFSAIFISFGVLNHQSDLVYLGSGLAILTYGGSATAAYLGVNRYNERLRRNLNLDAYRSPEMSQQSPGSMTSPQFGARWQWRF